MERHIQDKLELIKQLSEVETDWKDEFSSKFLRFLNELPEVLVTDGVTWKSRISDLEKLVKFQNDGYIYRIYTQAMSTALLSDLKQLKLEINL